MASMQHNSVVAHSLFVVALVIGATTCTAGPQPPVLHQLSEYNNGVVQSLGKLAVEKYNKNMNGRTHLFFIQVMGGMVWETATPSAFGWSRLWQLDIKAKNCSEPGLPALYSAGLAEQHRSDLIHLDDNNFRLWYGNYNLTSP